MCGRTCLTLQPKELIKACRYKHHIKKEENDNVEKCTITNNNSVPEYRSEFNSGRKYCPSYNIAPTDITPVLVSSDHFCNEDNKDFKNNRIIVPMMWGMIPSWHKGSWRTHGLSTNNCRLEHLLQSKLYLGPFKSGQRCVVLCEGFYEWQTTKLAKPSERVAYLIYMPQNEEIKIYDRNTWKPDEINLLKMAGLFNIWEDEHGDKIYSYSIITFESSEIMSWLHHRMPAILEDDEQVKKWLDFKNVTEEEALSTLRPPTKLRWHRVSNIVNNSRNKTDQCNKPIEIIKTQKPAMNKIMSSWLNIRKRKATLKNIGCDLKDEQIKDDKNNDIETTSDDELESTTAVKRSRL